MPSLVRHYWPCLIAICKSINDRRTITYGELAAKLGLKLARQEWVGLLDLVAGKTSREVDDDLTWIVVYANGPAKGLGRYFNKGGLSPGSTPLDPSNRQQVADYKRRLKRIF